MKISEILTEAHHSILMTVPFGPWKVQFDTHAFVSIPHRNIPLDQFVAILTYMTSLPDVLPTIPVNRGAYLQDTNTKISIYVTRVATDTIRVETVLDASMRPKAPLFRRPVPAWKPGAGVKQLDPAVYQSMQKATQSQGRDAVSQSMANLKPIMPVNRAERRKFSRMVKQLSRQK